MKIDIVITFNDISISKHRNVGFMPKIVAGSEITPVNQMKILINSIKTNLHRYEYEIFCVHSKACSPQIISELTKLGAKVKMIPVVFLPNRINNRITAYTSKFSNDSTHTLVLDHDMILINDFPELDETVDVLVAYDPLPQSIEPIYKQILTSLKLTELKERVLWLSGLNCLLYEYEIGQADGVLYVPYFNNGCVLVNNKHRATFARKLIDLKHHVLSLIANNKFSNRLNISSFNHFIEQTLMSLAVLSSNSKILPTGFNFNAKHLNYDKNKERIIFYHYLSVPNYIKSTDEILEYFKKYK